MRRLPTLAVLVVAACSGKPKQPDMSKVEPPPKLPYTSDTIPSSTAHIQLNCVYAGEDRTKDYAIDLQASEVDQCRLTAGHEISLILQDPNNPGHQMALDATGYVSPGGTYTPTSFYVVQSGNNAENCSDGTVLVQDDNPASPFPKQIRFVIDCPNLENSTTHTCTPALHLNLRVNCTD